MSIDNTIVLAILSLVNGGIVTALVQALKKWLKIEGGWKALTIAAVVSAASSAYVLVGLHAFTVPLLLIYSAVVFGESTGLYHLTGKPKTA